MVYDSNIKKDNKEEDKNYMLLSELKPGQNARIIGYSIDNAVSRRLVEMGLTTGRKVHYVRDAPLKDPLQISLGNNNNLMIRHEQASQIKIEVLGE